MKMIYTIAMEGNGILRPLDYSIKLEFCSTWLELSELLQDPELQSRVLEDEEKQPITDKDAGSLTQIILFKWGDRRIGYCLLMQRTSTVIDMHFGLLEEYRAGFAYKCLTLVYQWLNKQAGDHVNKLNICVPDIFTDVIAFAEVMGFKKEGVDRQSFKKDGKFIDRAILGITREEMKNVLCSRSNSRVV